MVLNENSLHHPDYSAHSKHDSPGAWQDISIRILVDHWPGMVADKIT